MNRTERYRIIQAPGAIGSRQPNWSRRQAPAAETPSGENQEQPSPQTSVGRPLAGCHGGAARQRFFAGVALPRAAAGFFAAAAVGIGLGNALSRDVVHIDLVGSAQAPAVVIAQNDRAVVLFRGGSAAQRAVENQLARRGVRTVELVADLRMNAKTACTLPAQQGIRAERLPVNASRKLRCTPAAVELLRTREGCLVRLSIGNRQFVTLSGKAELAQSLQTEWLIATPKKPEVPKANTQHGITRGAAYFRKGGSSK